MELLSQGHEGTGHRRAPFMIWDTNFAYGLTVFRMILATCSTGSKHVHFEWT
jgi:hypothetical protein